MLSPVSQPRESLTLGTLLHKFQMLWPFVSVSRQCVVDFLFWKYSSSSSHFQQLEIVGEEKKYKILGAWHRQYIWCSSQLYFLSPNTYRFCFNEKRVNFDWKENIKALYANRITAVLGFSVVFKWFWTKNIWVRTLTCSRDTLEYQ